MPGPHRNLRSVQQPCPYHASANPVRSAKAKAAARSRLGCSSMSMSVRRARFVSKCRRETASDRAKVAHCAPRCPSRGRTVAEPIAGAHIVHPTAKPTWPMHVANIATHLISIFFTMCSDNVSHHPGVFRGHSPPHLRRKRSGSSSCQCGRYIVAQRNRRSNPICLFSLAAPANACPPPLFGKRVGRRHGEAPFPLDSLAKNRPWQLAFSIRTSEVTRTRRFGLLKPRLSGGHSD